MVQRYFIELYENNEGKAMFTFPYYEGMENIIQKESFTGSDLIKKVKPFFFEGGNDFVKEYEQLKQLINTQLSYKVKTGFYKPEPPVRIGLNGNLTIGLDSGLDFLENLLQKIKKK